MNIRFGEGTVKVIRSLWGRNVLEVKFQLSLSFLLANVMTRSFRQFNVPTSHCTSSKPLAFTTTSSKKRSSKSIEPSQLNKTTSKILRMHGKHDFLCLQRSTIILLHAHSFHDNYFSQRFVYAIITCQLKGIRKFLKQTSCERERKKKQRIMKKLQYESSFCCWHVDSGNFKHTSQHFILSAMTGAVNISCSVVFAFSTARSIN
jgi:hypothetical protein